MNVHINGKFIGNFWGQVANNSFGLPLIPCPKGGTLKLDYGENITGALTFGFIYSD